MANSTHRVRIMAHLMGEGAPVDTAGEQNKSRTVEPLNKKSCRVLEDLCWTATMFVSVLSLALVAQQLAFVAAQCGNEGGSGPCVLPPWPPTWQMNASTIIMPCNYTG